MCGCAGLRTAIAATSPRSGVLRRWGAARLGAARVGRCGEARWGLASAQVDLAIVDEARVADLRGHEHERLAVVAV